MKISERMILLFNKKNALRVTIFTEDKRVKKRIVVVKNKTFDIGEMTYTIESEKVHYYKGLPYLSYREDSLQAIDPSNLEASAISPEEYFSAINQNIVLQIMRYATKGDQKILNMILISAGATIGMLGAGMYYLYTLITELSLQILTLRELLDQIIDTINNTGGF